jgi:pyrroline-5-carboxylate reductase
MKQAHSDSVAILGVGNLGLALARGLVHSGYLPAEHIRLTRRNVDLLAQEAAAGHPVGSDNAAAVEGAEIIVLAVQPLQLDDLLDEIREALDPARHLIVSTVSGASFGSHSQPGRRGGCGGTGHAQPGNPDGGLHDLPRPQRDPLRRRRWPGQSVSSRRSEPRSGSRSRRWPLPLPLRLRDRLLPPGHPGRGSGGIEIGFHAEDAILMAAQTAKGAAELLLASGIHPEMAIDRVTTPNGCTIAGLNEMENRGFSSAMIRGIVTFRTGPPTSTPIPTKGGRLLPDSFPRPLGTGSRPERRLISAERSEGEAPAERAVDRAPPEPNETPGPCGTSEKRPG